MRTTITIPGYGGTQMTPDGSITIGGTQPTRSPFVEGGSMTRLAERSSTPAVAPRGNIQDVGLNQAQAGGAGGGGGSMMQAGGVQASSGGSSIPMTSNPSSGESGGGNWFTDILNTISTLVNIGQGVSAETRAWQSDQFNRELQTATLDLNRTIQEAARKNEEFNRKLGVQNLNLAREGTRLNQATTAENLMTSGQARYQSGVGFEQAQEDRRRAQAGMQALAKGIGRGLMARQPQGGITNQNLPALTAGGAMAA
jgi:hypothetical protein